MTAGPFEDSPVLLPKLQSGTPEPMGANQVDLPIDGSGIARTMNACEDQPQVNSQLVSVSSSTTFRHTRILRRAL